MPLWGFGQKDNPNKGKDINLPLKGLPEQYPTGAPIGEHPAGLPESLMEKSIKGLGKSRGSLMPNDLPYLEQYLHPDYSVLERQSLRPTINPHGEDNLEYYKPTTLSGLGGYKLDSSNPNYNSVYDKWDFDTDAPLVVGKDGKLSSIKSLFGLPDYAAKQILTKAGKPFNVYDRLKKSDWMVTQQSNRDRDINLPKK